MQDIPDTLQFLLQRHSVSALTEPAPDAGALDLIIQAGLRAPDHGHLRPYSFIVATGDGIGRLGTLMQRAAIAAGKPDSVIQRAPEMPKRAPMVIIAVTKPVAHDGVPVFEQQLATGCAVMAMQMAAQTLGFGGIWRSGWFIFDRGFHSDLGLADEDQIVGFLYLGTPRAEVPVPPKDETTKFVRWL
jgi:nitroreductase